MLLVRNENFKQYMLNYPLTFFIISLNVFVFIITSLIGGLTNDSILYKLGGISFEYIQQKREYYRFVSYAFIHNGIFHLMMNMGIILLICPPIEKSLGKTKFTILFLGSIILSGLTILIFRRESGVGASGFDFGLFGIYLSIMILKKDLIDIHSRITILFLISFGWLYTFINKDVSIAGHFGGFIAGIIIGSFFIYTNGLKKFDYQEKNHNSTNVPQ